MGTTPGGQDLYEDLVQMTDRGRHQVADNPLLPPGASSAKNYLDAKGYDTTQLVTGGLDMGPCYAYALGELSNFRYAETAPPPYGQFIEGFTAIGELCTGASMALGMAKTLLDGVPTGQPPSSLCLGRTCGDDGCGGSCGTCAGGESCNAGGTCGTACVASCAGKACGTDDGCGGRCGACTDGGVAGPANGAAPGESDAEPATAGGCACRTNASSTTNVLGTSTALSLAAIAALAAIFRRRRTHA